jgi:hypothetical protein
MEKNPANIKSIIGSEIVERYTDAQNVLLFLRKMKVATTWAVQFAYTTGAGSAVATQIKAGTSCLSQFAPLITKLYSTQKRPKLWNYFVALFFSVLAPL